MRVPIHHDRFLTVHAVWHDFIRDERRRTSAFMARVHVLAARSRQNLIGHIKFSHIYQDMFSTVS